MRTTKIIIGMLTLTLCASQALAEAGPKKQQLFISILDGYYEEASNLDLRSGDEGFGGAIGFAPHDRWSVEAMFFDLDPGITVNGIDDGGELDYWSASILGKFARPENWQPYFALGGGRGEFDYGFLAPDRREDIYHAGLGVFIHASDRIAFRLDARGLYHNDADSISPMLFAGVTFMLGGSRDAPAPPADSDGDGVPDSRDACPGTPAGTPVDSRGCELDSDGDGVVDSIDECPDTPAGTPVDASGCPADGDADGDGVADSRDQCPNTPRGARVDDRGCELQLEREVSFDLTVAFATNSAEITGVAFQEMLELLRFLREYPSTTAVIEGHTDSTGAEDYNQNLSEQRAAAVVQALTNSGINRSRLTSRGYGESRPVASNDTAEGRAQNRRVTVVVSGTTTAPSS